MNWTEVVQSGFTAAMLGLNAWLVMRLTSFIDSASEEIKHSHERHDVTDRIVSSGLTKHPYHSGLIAKGHQAFPDIKGMDHDRKRSS